MKKQASLDTLYAPVERPLLDARSLQKHLMGGNAKGDPGSIDDFSAAASAAAKKQSEGKDADSTYQTLVLTHQKLQYKLLEPYKSEAGEGTLDLAEGALVTVEEKGDEGWWFATAAAAGAGGADGEGWIPAVMLDPVGEAPAVHTPARKSRADSMSVHSADSSVDLFKLNENYVSEGGEGNLNLKMGDIVTIEERADGGWWFAKQNAEQSGWIPETSVDPINMSDRKSLATSEEGVSSAAVTDDAAVASATAEAAATANTESADSTAAAVNNSNGGDGGNGGGGSSSTLLARAVSDTEVRASYVQVMAAGDWPRMIALYDSEASNDAELSFKAGTVILQVKEADPSGWAWGMIAGTDGPMAAYPANYVQPV